LTGTPVDMMKINNPAGSQTLVVFAINGARLDQQGTVGKETHLGTRQSAWF